MKINTIYEKYSKYPLLVRVSCRF